MKQPYYEPTCPVEAALQLIGGKYKTIILWHLLNKTMRYSELHRLVPRATDKMLAQQLRELEKDGLVNRKVYPVIPPKTEYSIHCVVGGSIIFRRSQIEIQRLVKVEINVHSRVGYGFIEGVLEVLKW